MRETYDNELLYCPDCESDVEIVESLESNGEGVAFGYIECVDCDFRAREEYVHAETVRMDES